MCSQGRFATVLQRVGRLTYSVAPAAQQVVGQGVLRLQLDGFIQVILGGGAETRGRFSLLIHETAAISLLF